jgi:predicted  nucleic acid-binding Zn-ribbon protein
MSDNQLELLVLYQDVTLMLQEALEEESNMGFPIKGKEELNKAKRELANKITPSLLSACNRLSTRYKYFIAPVQEDTCLGCFAKLPTSYKIRGREDKAIFTCENCGRILYWIS